MNKAKTYRIIRVAKELNVGIGTIAEFLNNNGFSVENKPNVKLDEKMYEALLNEYADEKLLKEKAAQVELVKNDHESIVIHEDEKEIKAKKKKEEQILIKSVITHEESAAEAEVKGPKVVGKIELEKPEAKEEKEESIKEVPETVTKDESEEESRTIEPEVIEQEKQKESPVEEIQQIETINTSVESLEGPKVIGKIELPVEKPKKKLVASSSDSFKPKKKKKTIKVTKDKKTSQKKEADKGRERKAKVDEKEVSEAMKATLAKLESNKKSSKKRRQRKSEGIEGEDIEIDDKILRITEFITVSEIATLMDVGATEIIMACMNLGVMVTMNQRLDAEIIELVAEEFGYGVSFIDIKDQEEEEGEEEDNPEDLKERPAIVTIMGHVDHGKTSLLDYIRNENVIAGEAGGITQHIGAYSVNLKDGRNISFLDTPGHEAFTAMRARGAKITDIAVIVVAADDAIMPQTKEAISHAQAAGVSMIFAINKIDKPDSNPEKIKEQLAGMDILVEDWGGEYQCQEISAKKGTNVEQLLEKILIDAELQELKANPDKNAVGTVIEASLDKGKGFLATMLVQNGTMSVGDVLLAGPFFGKVKALMDERGNRIKTAGPSRPVQVLGLNGAPQAGDRFKIYKSEQEAKSIANKRQQILREQGIRTSKHITLDEIGRRLALGNFQELNLIVKGDVDGSVEALSESLAKLSTDEVQISVIHKGVGAISESDILLASASDALVVGFQVRPTAGARKLAENEDIEIKLYSIIYNAIEEIKSAIEGMLQPTVEEKIVCNVEIKEVFKITKVGTIAGCQVVEGKINRNTKIRLVREGIVVYTGELASLKRYKDDVKEVTQNMECGLGIKNFNDIKVGDMVEGYEEIEIKRTLS